MRPRVAGLGLLLLACIVGQSSGYYMPGVVPQEFKHGEHLQGASAPARRAAQAAKRARPPRRRSGVPQTVPLPPSPPQ